jgi:hypothetical protein
MKRFRWRVGGIAALGLLAATACGERLSVRSDDLAALRIERVERAMRADDVVGEWRLDGGNPEAAALAAALDHCRHDPAKYVPKYRIVAARRSGTAATLLVLRSRVKLEGKVFACHDDIEALVERLIRSAHRPPTPSGA